MKKHWLVVACGALIVISAPQPVSAADQVGRLDIKAEVRAPFRATAFPAASSRLPLVVSVREAWESGANSWSAARRAAFIADPAVSATDIGLSKQANAQRADRDPAQWLPAPAQRCAYVAKWIAVKLAWSLAADSAEVARLRRVVSSCPVVSSTTTAAPLASFPTTTTRGSVSPANVPTTTTASAVVGGTTDALTELAKVKISPEYTTGYDRELFPHWKDLDGDGCDTRKEVLIRDSRSTAVVGSSCTVTSGTWYSPYDGATWTNPSNIQIDHVVALNEAWQSGAYAWTTQQRTNYANDLTDSRTLLAVTDSVNQSKSAKDPTQWLPPLVEYRCTYLANWVSVKVRWSLSMDEAEHATVKSALAGCGSAIRASPVALPQTPVVPTPSTAAVLVVSPGAFCSPFGATGVSGKGISYTCKPSETESRNRWRP